MNIGSSSAGRGPDRVGTDEVLDLRKVPGKVVIAQAVPYSGPRQRHLMMSLRQLLRIVGAADQRIMPSLGQPSLQHVQDNLRILRIVLVPELCIASRVRASAIVGINRSAKP